MCNFSFYEETCYEQKNYINDKCTLIKEKNREDNNQKHSMKADNWKLWNAKDYEKKISFSIVIQQKLDIVSISQLGSGNTRFYEKHEAEIRRNLRKI